jgi:hypothetical protein
MRLRKGHQIRSHLRRDIKQVKEQVLWPSGVFIFILDRDNYKYKGLKYKLGRSEK